MLAPDNARQLLDEMLLSRALRLVLRHEPYRGHQAPRGTGGLAIPSRARPPASFLYGHAICATGLASQPARKEVALPVAALREPRNPAQRSSHIERSLTIRGLPLG
jgi:hypothetical protein